MNFMQVNKGDRKKITYSHLGKALEKQIKTIEDQGEKQIKAVEHKVKKTFSTKIKN